LSIFLLSSQIVKSQSKIEELKKSVKDLSQPNKQFGLTENQEWANKIQTRTFEDQGKMYSTYLALNSDSTFIYLSIFEVGEYLVIGRWYKLNDTVIKCTSDQKLTMSICSDEKQYSKYYKYLAPRLAVIKDWAFIDHGTTLTRAETPLTDSSKIFEGFKKKLLFPLISKESIAAFQNQLQRFYSTQDLSFIADHSETVFVVFDGIISFIQEMSKDNFMVITKFGEYNMVYSGIKANDLYLGKHVRKGEKLSTTAQNESKEFDFYFSITKGSDRVELTQWIKSYNGI